MESVEMFRTLADETNCHKEMPQNPCCGIVERQNHEAEAVSALSANSTNSTSEKKTHAVCYII